jgi:Uma2 family endonuclease
MGRPREKRATYEDLLQVPATMIAEIIDGDLVASPRPAVRHANASSRLGGALDSPFHRGRGGPGGWIILDEPELHLGEDVVVPDLAGWRREHFSAAAGDAASIEIAPDWVCEVLSPSTAGVDRTKKLPIYAREKVLHAWLVDPIAKTLEVLRLVDERWTLVGAHEGDAKVRAEPFDAIEIDLAALWTL